MGKILSTTLASFIIMGEVLSKRLSSRIWRMEWWLQTYVWRMGWWMESRLLSTIWSMGDFQDGARSEKEVAYIRILTCAFLYFYYFCIQFTYF
ncbi:unnamed protein product [Strongylus vulgaris]|uniref:Uncharacterized protein n=1 Tax=Strongylus vulgaris TaxID=40348 RepID=A0A3P7LWH8_STRVU|nr:unnamed protein product [Strongylus vulgaris]